MASVSDKPYNACICLDTVPPRGYAPRMDLSAGPTPAFREATGLEPDAGRATPADAFRRAWEIVQSGQPLDMQALAAELGVARSTLYRWTGDRERLIADIAWAEVSSVLDHILQTTEERGVERIHVAADRFLGAMAGKGRLMSFLRHELDHGFRVITDPLGGVRPRIVDTIARAIQDEVDAGVYRSPDEPAALADGIVTVAERFLYHGGHIELDPEPEIASRMIALLVREPSD